MRLDTKVSRVTRGWRTLTLGLTASIACGPGGSDAEDAGPGLATVEVLDAGGASLGSVAFPVSCSEQASASMRLGLALLHNMTYTEAEQAFRGAAEEDPDCALAPWGMAMTYVHPLWPDVPTDEEFERGWTLLQEARERGFETPREEAYVAALEAYYRDGPERDEATRLAAYAEGWQQVRAAHPDDPEAALFAALSLMATAPGSDQTFAVQQDAGAMAEEVLARIPDHPGAHHYVIHAYDAPPLAEKALPVARSYGNVAPDNAHALHMTSHIFTRVGSWEESIDYNARSAEAALHHPINGATSHHHLHAVDYLAYAYLQRAEDGRAEEILTHLRALDGPVLDNAASAYAFAAVPARIALERRDWARAAGLDVRWPETIAWDRYPHLEAIPVFARALGAARTSDLESARRSIGRLTELGALAAEQPTAYDWGTQVEIQRLGASAWLAFAEGRTEEAVELMTEAADLEAGSSKNPVTPSEVLPATDLLGDMLLELDRHAEARAAYERTLDRSPNRLNSLLGAGRAAELSGDAAAAGEYYRHLLTVTAEGVEGHPGIDHAAAFVGDDQA